MTRDHDFDLLDEYLRALQAGEEPPRDRLLAERPELAPLLNCLDAIQSAADTTQEHAASPSAAQPASAIGEQGFERLEGFRILAELGRGGMGVVHRAMDDALGRVVAVKTVLTANLTSAQHLQRFRSEARTAARLRHPHIVPLHYVGESSGRPYLVMEYIEGESLAQRLAREGPLAPDEAARLIAQTARAVEYLHTEGVIHRDLKPSNILLGPSSHPYVSDFGLAKVLRDGADLTHTGALLGTPSYMAPELAAEGGRGACEASDIYGLGAILYECITGRPPHREESPLDTILQLLSVDPLPPRKRRRDIPAVLERICMRCLARDPKRRYPSAAALAEDLECYLRGETTEVRPPDPVSSLRAWSGREPALASRLIVLLIFSIVNAVNYSIGHVDRQFHDTMLAWMIVWAIGSLICGRLLRSPRFAAYAPWVWGVLDEGVLLGVLLGASGVGSALVVVYPMLIVGSAFWFRARFVSFMTTLSILSYGVLLAHYLSDTSALPRGIYGRPDRHIIFVVMLVVIGRAMAFLVRRIRLLRRYCQPQQNEAP